MKWVGSGVPRRSIVARKFSTTVGQLIASGVTVLLVASLDDGQMHQWGWRVPFVLGAVLSLVGFWIRRGARETRSEQQAGTRPTLFEALWSHPHESLLICGITAGGTIAYYTWTSYLPTYAQVNAGFDKADSLLAGTISLVFFVLLQPLAGMLSDRVGRKPLLLTFAAGFALLRVPLLQSINDSFVSLLLVQCAGMVLLSDYTSIAAAVNAEIFPARVRVAGIGFPYSLTVALFGGTAPYMGTLFEELGRPGTFPWYVAALCPVSGVVYLRLPEGAKKTLER